MTTSSSAPEPKPNRAQRRAAARRRFELACRACGCTWPDETPLEQVQKHMQSQHDRTDIQFMLRRVPRLN